MSRARRHRVLLIEAAPDRLVIRDDVTGTEIELSQAEARDLTNWLIGVLPVPERKASGR